MQYGQNLATEAVGLEARLTCYYHLLYIHAVILEHC